VPLPKGFGVIYVTDVSPHELVLDIENVEVLGRAHQHGSR
jgi:hypothetical protein